MQYSKDGIKQLIGQNRLDEAVDELLDLTNNYLSAKRNDKFVGKISDALLINSGKLKGLIHDENLGILSSEEKNITKAEVNKAILYVIDQLPDTVFQFSKSSEFLENSETTEQSRLREGVKILKGAKSELEYDVFLSFSSKDREEARQVWEKLRGYGLRVFLSDEALKIEIGTSFFEKINYGLQNSHHLVWLCTPNALQSKYVRLETETFFNQFFEGDRRLIILKGTGFSLDLLLPIYRSLQIAESAEQIVHALIDKAKQLKIENEKLRIKQEAADKKRLAELETQHQIEREELERRALEEIERKEKEESERIKNEKLRKEKERQEEQRIKEIAEKAENTLWQQAQNRKSKTAYKQYLQKYPKGKYQFEAKKQIEIIEAQKKPFDYKKIAIPLAIVALVILIIWIANIGKSKDPAFELAKKRNTIEAYTDYLELTPESDYKKEANDSIATLKTRKWFAQAVNNMSLDGFKQFKDSMKAHAFIDKKLTRKAEYYIDSLTKAQISDGTFTDPRDNKIYKTIRIGTQTWFAENLAYTGDNGYQRHITDGNEWTNNSKYDGWCYFDNNSSKGSKYGVLYQWEAAKNACPSGWHLPSDDEWKQLEMYLGMTKTDADKTAWRGNPIGKKLKNTSGWANNGNGNNESGFKALPSGYRNYGNGKFNYAGNYGQWWTSTPDGSSDAYHRGLNCDYGEVYRGSNYREFGFSVCCVRD